MTKFEKHSNSASSIVKVMCPIYIYPSCEFRTFLTRKKNPKLNNVFNILKTMFHCFQMRFLKIVHEPANNITMGYAIYGHVCVRKIRLYTNCWQDVMSTSLEFMFVCKLVLSFMGVAIEWHSNILNLHNSFQA